MSNSLRSPSERAELVLRLWATSPSVGDARHALRDFCDSGGRGDLTDDVVLLTSELMTNACRVATGLITLVAMRSRDGIVVSVNDDNTDAVPASATELPTADADSGRGLYLIDQIAGSWGTTRYPHGKSVWFRMP